MKKLLLFLALAAAGLSAWAADLYLVGGALSVGWNKENLRATVMIETGTNTHIYEWTGYINSGGTFKILRQTNSWDYGYNAPGKETTLSSTESGVWYRNGSGNADDQWKVSTSGVYKITFDQEAMTIKAESATLTATVPTYTDGYYQIGSADDLVNFADAINKGVLTPNVKAKLIDNIDMDGRTDFAPICWAEGIKFTGEFDGQGKSITNLNLDYGTTFGYAALIGFATDGAEVKNVIVSGSVKGLKRVAGIVGMASGGGTITLTNVINMVNVDATGNDEQQNAAGLVGCGDGTVISAMNCANMGEIKNSGYTDGTGQCAAFAGWTSKVGGTKTTFTNCWNSGDIYNMDSDKSLYRNDDAVTATDCYDANGADFYTQGTKIARASVASGKLCYKLGHGTTPATWTQTIGTDSYPIPFDTQSTVNEVVPNVSYSNLTIFDDDDDDKVQISKKAELIQFSKEVNAGNEALNAVLTADIDMSEENSHTPIGTETYKYIGTFNGQGHTVNLCINKPADSYQGLFGIVTDGVYIEKVIVKGSVTGYSFVGGIVGGTNGGSSNVKQTNIWYCGNEATITAKNANGGGIIGVNMNADASIILTNCYNKGNVTSNLQGGALSGWLGDGKSSVRNCYNIGIVKDDDGETISHAFARNNGNTYFTNCYYTESSGTDNSSETRNNGQPTEVADAAVASGLLCAKLGYGFRQNLGEGGDAKPNFNVDHGFVSQIGEAGYSTMYNIHSDVTIPSGITAYIGTISDDRFMLEPLSEKIKASTPVVLKGTAGLFNFMPATGASAAESNDLLGSNGSVTGGDGIYALAKKSDVVGFYPVESTVTIPEGRAYLNTSAGVKGFTFVFDDDATAIEMVNGQSSMVNDNEIYNLAGQRIQKMQRGINIVGGRKVLF